MPPPPTLLVLLLLPPLLCWVPPVGAGVHEPTIGGKAKKSIVREVGDATFAAEIAQYPDGVFAEFYAPWHAAPPAPARAPATPCPRRAR